MGIVDYGVEIIVVEAVPQRAQVWDHSQDTDQGDPPRSGYLYHRSAGAAEFHGREIPGVSFPGKRLLVDNPGLWVTCLRAPD